MAARHRGSRRQDSKHPARSRAGEPGTPWSDQSRVARASSTQPELARAKKGRTQNHLLLTADLLRYLHACLFTPLQRQSFCVFTPQKKLYVGNQTRNILSLICGVCNSSSCNSYKTGVRKGKYFWGKRRKVFTPQITNQITVHGKSVENGCEKGNTF